jgi:hypothetical protein
VTLAAAIVALAVSGAGAPSAEPHEVPDTRESREGIGTLVPRARPPNIVVPAVHSIALMGVMRVAESVIWPDPFSRPEQFGPRYEEAFTRPPRFDPNEAFMRWDGDPFVVNGVGHALFGSELYLRARQCRFGWAGSLAFAAATSAIWEYGVEANGARPSGLDLVYTPLSGLLLGEARYFLHRAAGALSSPVARGILRGVLDPLGDVERALGTDC